ncbi:acyltransferase [Dyadobacter sp. CY261]|uniref:acyltransferase n=1 Tax=Dyadobacter sp. CY261 TaxID=2907203 RepID=UPI001F31AD16|nr:acyltransferase [Dyadobacter sp. CY261]MCF0074494.1 acyltransferase [Dyadobacter sp. CY261]
MILRELNFFLKRIRARSASLLSPVLTRWRFSLNGVEYKSFTCRGVPIVEVDRSGKLTIGENFTFYSGTRHNMIGRQQPCYFIVNKNAVLRIGNNVGISCAAIVCHNSVTIEDNVKIGGGVVIYDTDFHSLNASERNGIPENFDNVKTNPVHIKSGAFIGSHATILKGVTVGENSIVASGSVVVKSIPDFEIWGGNPARFIRVIDA